MATEKAASTFDWKTELVRMGIGQGPAFVVMVVMLWILTSAIKDFVKIEIPKHIEAIKLGYKDIAEMNNKTNLEVAKLNATTIKYLSDTFNHNIDRIEKKLDELLRNKLSEKPSLP